VVGAAGITVIRNIIPVIIMNTEILMRGVNFSSSDVFFVFITKNAKEKIKNTSK
jgi:NADH:ubiquinone oxidoreductase subunit K